MHWKLIVWSPPVSGSWDNVLNAAVEGHDETPREIGWIAAQNLAEASKEMVAATTALNETGVNYEFRQASETEVLLPNTDLAKMSVEQILQYARPDRPRYPTN